MLLIWTLLDHNTQPVLIFFRVRTFHLERLEKVTWFHSFDFQKFIIASMTIWNYVVLPFGKTNIIQSLEGISICLTHWSQNYYDGTLTFSHCKFTKCFPAVPSSKGWKINKLNYFVTSLLPWKFKFDFKMTFTPLCLNVSQPFPLVKVWWKV